MSGKFTHGLKKTRNLLVVMINEMITMLIEMIIMLIMHDGLNESVLVKSMKIP